MLDVVSCSLRHCAGPVFGHFFKLNDASEETSCQCMKWLLVAFPNLSANDVPAKSRFSRHERLRDARRGLGLRVEMLVLSRKWYDCVLGVQVNLKDEFKE